MKGLFFLLVLNFGLNLNGQLIQGFRPDNAMVCIPNDNASHSFEFVFSINRDYYINLNKVLVDSFFIDTLEWKVKDGDSKIYQNNIPVSFPIRIKTNTDYTFTLKVNCKDSISIKKPKFYARLYQNNSHTPLELDLDLYEHIYNDTIPVININTFDYGITIVNDNACSNLSKNNFRIFAPKGELSYKWNFNQKVVSTTEEFYYTQSGTLKLETILASNKCPSESKTFSVVYENPPDQALLKKDVWNTVILIDKYDTTAFPNYKTLWYKDNMLYTNKTSTTMVLNPEIGTYYAILQGKACKQVLKSVEVSALPSSINNIEIPYSSFFEVQNHTLKAIKEFKIQIFTIDGKQIINKLLKNKDCIELTPGIFSIIIEDNNSYKFLKLSTL